MSDRKRTKEREDKGDHKKHKTSKQDFEKRHVESEKRNQEVQKIKHVETL